MNHVLVLENVSTVFKHSNLFKQTNHVLMRLFVRICVLIAFVKLTETCQLGTPHHVLCQGVTHQQEPYCSEHEQDISLVFFPSNAFMASARSFNMFQSIALLPVVHMYKRLHGFRQAHALLPPTPLFWVNDDKTIPLWRTTLWLHEDTIQVAS